MCGEVVPDERLSTIFVNSLQNLFSVNIIPNTQYLVEYYLISCSISESGEEREELAASRRRSLVLEDNLVQSGCRANLEDRQLQHILSTGIECPTFP